MIRSDRKRVGEVARPCLDYWGECAMARRDPWFSNRVLALFREMKTGQPFAPDKLWATVKNPLLAIVRAKTRFRGEDAKAIVLHAFEGLWLPPDAARQFTAKGRDDFFEADDQFRAWLRARHERSLEMLWMKAKGIPVDQMAKDLGVSNRSVRRYLRSLGDAAYGYLQRED
jgi:hypothetical protein